MNNVKSVVMQLDCGRSVTVTASQAVTASLLKAKRAKMSERISNEIRDLHPGLGRAGNQFAGWFGRRKHTLAA